MPGEQAHTSREVPNNCLFFYESAVNIAAGQGRQKCSASTFACAADPGGGWSVPGGGGFFLWRAGACKPASSVRSEAAKGFQRVTNGLIYWLILPRWWTLGMWSAAGCRRPPALGSDSLLHFV